MNGVYVKLLRFPDPPAIPVDSRPSRVTGSAILGKVPGKQRYLNLLSPPPELVPKQVGFNGPPHVECHVPPAD